MHKSIPKDIFLEKKTLPIKLSHTYFNVDSVLILKFLIILYSIVLTVSNGGCLVIPLLVVYSFPFIIFYNLSLLLPSLLLFLYGFNSDNNPMKHTKMYLTVTAK